MMPRPTMRTGPTMRDRLSQARDRLKGQGGAPMGDKQVNRQPDRPTGPSLEPQVSRPPPTMPSDKQVSRPPTTPMPGPQVSRPPPPMGGAMMKRGGKVKGMASGGSASSRGDGIAQRGKTKGKMC